MEKAKKVSKYGHCKKIKARNMSLQSLLDNHEA